ncbi:phosphonoacetaldehyde hydrolase [Pirellulaceae bacterium SH449]
MRSEQESYVLSESQLLAASKIPWHSLRGLLLDWAGTMVDHGSLAPVEVVRSVFAEYQVEVTETEARQPMGKAKIDHLREVLSMPRVAQAWHEAQQRPVEEKEIQEIYRRFLVLQKTVLARHAELIPGAIQLVELARARNLKIGSTTGYTRELMDVLEPLASEAGYAPDATVCSDEVAAGRPAPWSNFRAAERIGVYPMQDLLVVDDSVAGIQAGKSAGCYAVAVTVTGNPFGISLEELALLDPEEVHRRHLQAEQEFYNAGADLVVQSVGVLRDLWLRHV